MQQQITKNNHDKRVRTKGQCKFEKPLSANLSVNYQVIILGVREHLSQCTKQKKTARVSFRLIYLCSFRLFQTSQNTTLHDSCVVFIPSIEGPGRTDDIFEALQRDDQLARICLRASYKVHTKVAFDIS